MSWDHSTTGWQKMDGLIAGFDALGLPYELVETDEQYTPGADLYNDRVAKLRIVRFSEPNGGQKMVAQEWLAVDDGDCDGNSLIEMVLYPEGEQPLLLRRVLQGGHRQRVYQAIPLDADGYVVDEFRYCLNDGSCEVMTLATRE